MLQFAQGSEALRQFLEDEQERSLPEFLRKRPKVITSIQEHPYNNSTIFRAAIPVICILPCICTYVRIFVSTHVPTSHDSLHFMQYYYYYRYMRKRISELHPQLPEAVMDKLLTYDAEELDTLLKYPSAVHAQVD